MSTPAAHEPVMIEQLGKMDRRRRRRAVLFAVARAVGATALLLVIYGVLPVRAKSPAELGLRIAIGLLLAVLVVAWQLREVNRAELPQLRAVEALAVTVSVIVIAFAIAYGNMSSYHDTSFSEPLGRISALYFTMTTLTTIGYGDITPETDSAQILVMVQMVANVVLIGTLVRLTMQLVRYRIMTPRPAEENVSRRSRRRRR
jgi:voltage-gated potassium channel Kch